MGSPRPHVCQHVERTARLRYVERLAHQPGPVVRRGLPLGKIREHILDVDHADRLVERFPINRQARVAVLGELRNQLVPARFGIDRDNLAARNSDIVCVVFAEMQQVAEHGAFRRRQIALGLFAIAIGRLFLFMLVNRFFDLGSQRLVAFAFLEEAADCFPQPASTVRVSLVGVAVSGRIGHRPLMSPSAWR